MTHHRRFRIGRILIVCGVALAVGLLLAPLQAECQPAFRFSTDPAVAAQQHAVYDVVHRYEQLLNVGDTAGILALYAPDSVAEWNDKPTFVTPQDKKDAYDALFRIARFSTVFGYAGIEVEGDTAVVRTFHHKGATVLEAGKEVVDLNREVFVLRKLNGDWKIRLYIFNTDPVQGEG
jgi:ketosteroid isomerase-like protein